MRGGGGGGGGGRRVALACIIQKNVRFSSETGSDHIVSLYIMCLIEPCGAVKENSQHCYSICILSSAVMSSIKRRVMSEKRSSLLIYEDSCKRTFIQKNNKKWSFDVAKKKLKSTTMQTSVIAGKPHIFFTLLIRSRHFGVLHIYVFLVYTIAHICRRSNYIIKC